jgi:DNA-binding MarR family transcriptional regulator
VDELTQVEAVERELAVLFGRARSFSLAMAAQVDKGLDGAAYALLVHLAGQEPMRAATLAEQIGLDKSTISRVLTKLSERGLIVQVPDPDDGRARLLALSELGKEKLSTIKQRRRDALRSRFDDWTSTELATFARQLAKLNGSL